MSINRNRPIVPFVEFKIGDFDLTPIPPEMLQSFTHTRVLDKGNNFELTVFDQTALDLGDRIAEGYKDVSFSYGWFGISRSGLYTGMINDYEAVFEAGGASLSIIGTTNAMKAHGQSHIRDYRSKDGSEGILIHKIIEQIAEEEGWILGNVRRTKPVYCLDSLQFEEPTHKIFRQEGEPSTKFIMDKLAEHAISDDTGESGYILWFDDTRDGTVVNFAPATYSNRPDREYIFEWNAPRSPVISFAPRFQGLVQAMAGKTSRIRAVTVDDVSNDFFEEVYDQDSNEDREVSGSRTYDATDYNTIINSSSGSPDEIRRKIAKFYSDASRVSYNAELQIFGDVDIKTFTNISVIPLTREGIAHHTAGIYMAQSVTDAIEGGSFTSTCVLIRNASRVGESESTGKEVSTPEETGEDREDFRRNETDPIPI